MKYKKLKFLAAAAVAALFIGCSSDSHSPSKPSETSAKSSSSVDLDELLGLSSSSTGASADKNPAVASSSSKTSASSGVVDQPVEVSLTRSACDKTMGDIEWTALDATNSKAFDMFKALNNGRWSKVKDISAEVKPMYAKILKKYPNSCAAQLGYAIANLFDLSNNAEIGDYVETFFDANEATEHYYSEKRIAEFLNTFSAEVGSSFTVYSQNVIAKQILPALDTSIVYMQNILAQDDYKLEFKADGKTRELDKSEFGPGLGAMFAAKALLTMVVSMNLEFDNNGSYSWFADMKDVYLTDTVKHNSKQTAAIKFLNSLVGKSGVFSSINKGWESKWKSVPALLDSALRETRAGFKYALNDEDQDYDIYVVGNGADADISAKDMQDAVSIIDVVLNEVLDGPYLVDFRELEIADSDFSITVDIKKFFENTKGYEGFLPFYVLEDASDFGTLYFTDVNGKKVSSIRDFQHVRFTKETVYSKIFFPDPTFGGIFPKMKTQQDVWDLLIELDRL